MQVFMIENLDEEQTIYILLVAIIALFIYFIPSVIAGVRHKSNFTAIFILNLFLGWSFIGWVVSLVWALTTDHVPSTIVLNNQILLENNRPKQTNDSATTKLQEGDESILQTDTSTQMHEKIEDTHHQIRKLKQYKQLYDDGIISKETYDKQKRKILSDE